MGILRFILAFAVLIDHCGGVFGFYILPGFQCVQAFYIISGFYISLVWNEKYSLIQNSYKLFITNRILRLYPLYILVLVAMISQSVIYGSILNVGSHYYIGRFTSRQIWRRISEIQGKFLQVFCHK